MNVRFFGVRGSTPCSHDGNRRYGGNTSCVALEVPGSDPIVFDLGTGLRYFGQDQPHDGTFRAHALVSHLHWDHVQGLPFCVPLNRIGARLSVYGPPQEGLSLKEAFEEFMRPPYFPVRVSDLAGEVEFNTLDDDEFALGEAKVRAAYVPHIGATFGYRVELDGATVVYISDHQQPLDGGMDIAPEVLELADGADLLIHDAQYTADEFTAKAHWGHCTIGYALHVAREAGARCLALFHHDPSHDDHDVDSILSEARGVAHGNQLDEIIAASEGMTLTLGTVVGAR